MTFPGWTWSSGIESIRVKLERVIGEWKGTPYAVGLQSKGVGVDCVRFVTGVMDEMADITTDITSLPQDAYLHDPVKARSSTKAIISLYSPFQKVLTSEIQPGDVLVVGPNQGGPGHAYIVGCNDNELWDTTSSGVHKTSYAAALMNNRIVHRAYRVLNTRYRWLTADEVLLEDVDVPDIGEEEPVP